MLAEIYIADLMFVSELLVINSVGLTVLSLRPLARCKALCVHKVLLELAGICHFLNFYLFEGSR